MIGITFALPAESSGLRNHLRDKRKEGDLVSGRLGDHAIAICHTGVGATHSNRVMEQLLHKARPRLVISSGFAGAVANDLKVRDLILAENFSDPVLLGRAKEILSDRQARTVKLFTSAAIVDSIDERNEIADASGAAAVDMETGSISEICKGHGVPMISLRAISDTPSDPLPAPADILFDIASQRTRHGRLFAYLLRHPGSIAPLLNFARRIKHVRADLTEAIIELVRGL